MPGHSENCKNERKAVLCGRSFFIKKSEKIFKKGVDNPQKSAIIITVKRKTNREPKGRKDKTMNKNFENRIVRERIVDTKNYRYILAETATTREIKRIRIDLLDTTAAIDGWETVKKF